jgi:hypothetical protein
VLKGGKGKSLTSWLKKAGAVAYTQQSGQGKFVKAVVGEQLHRLGGKTTSHMSYK